MQPRACLFPRLVRTSWIVVALALASGSAAAATRALTVAATSLLEPAGLLAQLVPAFRQASGLDVKVVYVTGAQALEMARRGEADVVLVDDRAAADKLVAEGNALKRVPVMSNDFLLVGPKGDPAGTKGKDVVAALKKIDGTRALFISRGDRSTTHQAELRYWTLAGFPVRKGSAYRECKCGMGAALDIAANAFAYTLADRGTWLSFRNRVEMEALVEGDPRLMQTYDALAVNVERQARGKASDQRALASHRARDAQKFMQWIASPAAQSAIGAFKVAGQPYFFPATGK